MAILILDDGKIRNIAADDFDFDVLRAVYTGDTFQAVDSAALSAPASAEDAAGRHIFHASAQGPLVQGLEPPAGLPEAGYAVRRRLAYPPLAEQMDMQFHDRADGTTTWADAIAAVKAAHPKEGA